MSHVMLDLETLSTRANAAILIIGAIKFSEREQYDEKLNEEGLSKLNTFYRRISYDSFSENKYHVDEKTVSWWEAQDKEIAFEALQSEPRFLLKQALNDFVKWIGSDKDRVKIWGNGSSFDVTILGEAFAIEGIEPCWNFWNVRDLRTVMDIGGVKMNDLPQFKKHNAIWDCYRQIIGYQRSIINIKKNLEADEPMSYKKRKT
jgi:hypothetical protein